MNALQIRRLDPLRLYVWIVCVTVFAGESATLLLTDKFWPQGMDELFFVACLLILSARPLPRKSMQYGNILIGRTPAQVSSPLLSRCTRPLMPFSIRRYNHNFKRPGRFR